MISYSHVKSQMLTITLKPSLYGNKYTCQWLDSVKDVYDTFLDVGDFLFYPELTLAGNIHYHGILNIDNKDKWFTQCSGRMKRRFGFCDRKPIADQSHFDNSLKYIQKENTLMAKLLSRTVDEITISPKGYYVPPKRTTLMDHIHLKLLVNPKAQIEIPIHSVGKRFKIELPSFYDDMYCLIHQPIDLDESDLVDEPDYIHRLFCNSLQYGDCDCMFGNLFDVIEPRTVSV